MMEENGCYFCEECGAYNTLPSRKVRQLESRIDRALRKLWLVYYNQNPFADEKAEIREAMANLKGNPSDSGNPDGLDG